MRFASATAILLSGMAAVTVLSSVGPAPLAHAADMGEIACGESSTFGTAWDAATGAIVAHGTTDPNWQVSEFYPQNSPFVPIALPADIVWHPAWSVGARPGWRSSPVPNADWIASESSGYSALGDEDVAAFYQTTLTLAPKFDPTQLSLALDLNTDDQIVEIYVNGVAQSTTVPGLPGSTAGYSSAGTTSVTLNSDWKAGANTLTIQTGSVGGYEGILADGHIAAATCLAELPSPTAIPVSSASPTLAATGVDAFRTVLAAGVAILLLLGGVIVQRFDRRRRNDQRTHRAGQNVHASSDS